MSHPDLVVDLADSRLDDLVDSWNELALASGGSFFQTAAWARAWWLHLASKAPTKVALWMRADDSAEAVSALSQTRQPILKTGGPAVNAWVLTGSGAGAGDHLGWLGESSDSVLDWMVSDTSGPVILTNLARTEGLEERGFVQTSVDPTLTVDMTASDDWFQGSNDFRKKLRYYARQLDKLGVTLEMVDRVTTEVFDALLSLHAVRSESLGWSSTFDSARRQFHLELVANCPPEWGPRACVATRYGEIVGVLYGFSFGDTFSYYQTGWSYDYVKQSLGSVMVAHAMEHAAGAGAKVFDFLRGDDEYKRRFGATVANDSSWLLPRGTTGRLVAARTRVAQRVRG